MKMTKDHLNKIRRARRTNDANHWNWGLTFAGQKMGHNYRLYSVIDQIMKEYTDIKGIVELGTGRGALTTVLGLWGIKRDLPVLTIDRKDKHDNAVFEALKITYIKTDLYGDLTKTYVEVFIENHSPLLFICDGGNKIKEFNYWAPRLNPGSIICAHDWNMEIDMGDIKDTVERYCDPTLSNLWEAFFVQFAIFEVK